MNILIGQFVQKLNIVENNIPRIAKKIAMPQY